MLTVSKKIFHKKRPSFLSKNTVIVLSAGLVLGLFLVWFFLLRGGNAAAWYHDGWGYRKKLTIDHTKVSGDGNLTDFPVLISLTSDTHLSSNAQADGDDIMFTDSIGNKLDHEIESYSSGTLVAWVRIPTLYGTQNTDIYMYYGNSSVASQENGAGVWGDDYEGVWHMNETSDGSMAVSRSDSTQNANSLTDNNTTPSGTGKFNAAADIEEDNSEYLRLDDSSAFRNTYDSFTATAWVKAEAVTSDINENAVMAKNSTGTGTYEFRLQVDYYSGGCPCFELTTSVDGTYDGQSTIDITPTGSMQAETWYFVSVWYDSETGERGIKVNNQTAVTDTVATVYKGTADFVVAAERENSFAGRMWDGEIDEVRYVRSFRSEDWLNTEYNNQNSPSTFYSTGYQEERTRGPVAYWRFDEGNGTDVNDSSGNGITGALGTGSSAPTWQSKEYCVSEKCLQFDGNTDYVEINDSEHFDAGDELTVSAWFKTNTSGEYQTIIARDSEVSGDRYWGIQISSSDQIYAYVFTSADGLSDQTFGSSGDISPNTWYHVAYVVDGASSTNVYLNGTLLSGTESISATLKTGDEKIQIGTRNSGEYLSGFIDDVKIYSYARTADEIKQDYLFSSSRGSAAVLGAQDQSFLSEGLVGYWDMEGIGTSGNGVSIPDQSGNGNDGTTSDANGSGMSCTSAGKYGGGCDFDGTDDYINAGSNATLDQIFSGGGSVSLWVNRDTSSAAADFLVKGSNSTGGLGWVLFGSNSNTITFRKAFTSSNGIWVTTSAVTTDGSWDHIVVTYNQDSAANDPTIYVNGVIASITESTQPSGSAYDDSSHNLTIGAHSSNSFTDGKIDETRLYNRTLSAAEVMSLYQWAPGPITYWNFDEGSGTSTINDISGNGNDGTMGTAMTEDDWVQGRYGNALNFGGNNNERVYNATSGGVNGLSQFTASIWVKTNDWDVLTGEPTVFDFGAGGGLGGLRYLSASRRFQGDFVIGGTTHYFGTGTNSIPDDSNWHYLTITYNGSIVKAYVDGVQTSSTAATGRINGTAGITVGSTIGTVRYFPGVIDEVKIYNYARSQMQIMEDMNAGHPAVGTPVGSTVLHLRMDEGYGSIAHDSSPQGNDATISGSTWTNDGKSGKGMSFNGTSGYVNAGSDASLDNLSTVTVSAWIYPTGYGEGNFGRIVNKSDTSNTNWALTLVNDSSQQSIRFFKERNTASNATQVTAANGSIQLNRWYHVVGVYDENATPRMKLFINGAEASYAEQIEGTGTPDTDASYDLSVGNRLGGDRTFQGTIDEVKVYPFALSEEQIKVDIQGGKSMVFGAQSTGVGGTSPSNSSDRSYCVPGDTSTCSAPVLELDFEEATGQTAYDTSTNGNNGQLGSASGADSSDPTWGLGPDHMAGSAVELDGTDDYVRVADSASLDFQNGSISVSMWVYWNGSSNYERILSKANTGSPWHGDFYLQINGAESPQKIIGRFKTGSGTSENPIVETTTDFPANQWVFVSATFNTATNTSRLFINGALIDEDTSSTEEIADNSGFLCVGCNSSFASSNFNGKIDNVRIYDYARTPAQIAWEYSKGAPIAHYRLDECQSTTAYNSAFSPSGAAGNNGTINAGSSGNTSVGTCASGSSTEMWANGASGQWGASLDFDETDDRLVIPDMALGQEFTVSFWFNSDDNTGTGYQYMYSHGTIQTANSINIYFNEDSNAINTPGTILVSVMDSDDSIPLLSQDVQTQVGLSDNSWHHLVMTISSTGTKAYIDGVQQISYTNGNGGVNPSGDIYIGARNDLNSLRFFDGKIDDIRIYNYPLTTTQIKEVYKGGAVTFR